MSISLTKTVDIDIELQLSEILSSIESEYTLEQIVQEWPNTTEKDNLYQQYLDDLDIDYFINQFTLSDILNELDRTDIANYLLGND